MKKFGYNFPDSGYNTVLKKGFIVMKITLLIILTATLNLLAAGTYSQTARISLNLNQTTVKQVLKEIERSSEFYFLYNNELVDVERKVDVHATDKPIGNILDDIFAGQDVKYAVYDRQIVVSPTNMQLPQEQQKKITGAVKDENGEPIPGATIIIDGTTVGTTTDFDGNYTLNAPVGSNLIFSFVGYATQRVVVGQQNIYNVTLAQEAIGLDEIVAIGYGIQRKSDQTGASSRVTEGNMNKGVATSPTEMIQGRVSGVNVTQNNGEPGGGMSIRIRGSNSIRSGQDPLYVIDGVPLDNADLTPDGGSASGISGSANKNPISFLNPEDIESIDILKDASSTAIYGARGANGVILVTTKKGSKGEATISYDGYAGVSNIRKKLDLLSPSEFRSYRKADGSALLDQGASNDWQDLIFQSAVTQSHNISYGGGTDKMTYRASVGYLDQEGILKTTDLEKINGKIKVTQKMFDGKLNLEGSLIASHVKDRRAPIGETGGFEGDVILTAVKLNPTYPIYNQDGSYFQYSKDQRNPLAMLNLTNDITNTDRIIGNMSADLEITKNLRYKINFGLDRTVAERRVNQDYHLTYLTNKGEANINSITAANRLIENYLTYDLNINDEHRFNILAGHAYQYFKVTGSQLRVFGFEVDDVLYTNKLQYGNFSTAETNSSAYERELQSFFGRVNYVYKDKYLATITGRADGSSKFGENKKYGFFPSTALAWKASEEEFIKNMNLFSTLKVRLGWGLTGNQEIPDKISLLAVGTTPSANGYFNNTLTPGITFLRTPNPDLQWETTMQTNFGIDFGFFKNRLTGTIDIFNKQTKDVLLEIPAKAPAATQTQWQNVPDLKIINNGIELGLDGTLISKKDLTLDLGFNIAYIKNEVKNLPVKLIETGNASGQGLSGTRVQIITNGQPIGTFYGRVFEGYDSNGISIYKKDSNGNDVLDYIGSALPDFTYSFSTKLQYKNFDFNMFWYGSQGNDVYNNKANAIFVKGTLDKGANVTKSVFESNESPSNSNAFSSRFIEDGSFLRLSNVTIGYTVNTKSLKWINKARIYATGNNLLLITNYSGYDPEVNVDANENGVPSIGIDYTPYPKARTFTFGVNLTF